MKCSIPASLASSNTYWINGLSTMVSISFGIALVAGRTRVPRPATGKTALRIFMGSGRDETIKVAVRSRFRAVHKGGEPATHVKSWILLNFRKPRAGLLNAQFPGQRVCY